MLGAPCAGSGDRWFHSWSNPPDDDVELPHDHTDSDVGDDDDGEHDFDAEAAVAAVRAQILALLSTGTKSEGMLGDKISRAYKELYGVSWKEACGNVVRSLVVLLDTPQFRRVKRASGTDNCFFAA